MIIEIYYPKLTEKGTYLHPGILVEVGCRSLKEPYTQRVFKTMVSEAFPDKPYSDTIITIPTVNPERTFLEKVFLLHEEYQRPSEKIRVKRLSRHLYDIEKLSQTSYFLKALADKNLYNTIVEHRSKFAPIGDVDYTKHLPQHIRIVPPAELLPLWEKDYYEMIESMIHGEKLPFAQLIERISTVQETINNLEQKSTTEKIQEIEQLSSNHTGTMQLRDGQTVNYGAIRVIDNNFVYYTGKGLREMWKPAMIEEEKKRAEELKRNCEQKLIDSKHIAIKPLDDIVRVIS